MGLAVRSVLTAVLVQLDPLVGPLPSHPSVSADAVEVVGVRCGGPPPPGRGERGVAVARR